MSQPPPDSTNAPGAPGAGTAGAAPKVAGEAGASPSPAPAGAGASSPGPEASEGGGLQIPLFVGVVALLCAVLWFQLPAIETKLAFRSLRKGLTQQKAPSADEAALKTLKDRGPELLEALTEEIAGGGSEAEIYRAVLIAKVLAPMEGDAASRVLMALAKDESTSIRANVYQQIAVRAEAKLMEREQATTCLVESLAGEPVLQARGMAACALIRLGNRAGIWQLIMALRHLPPADRHVAPAFVASLQSALGPEVTLDLKAKPEVQIRQMMAIEAAYTAQGGKIPPGQDLQSVLDDRAAKAKAGGAAPGTEASKSGNGTGQ